VLVWEKTSTQPSNLGSTADLFVGMRVPPITFDPNETFIKNGRFWIQMSHNINWRSRTKMKEFGKYI